MDALVSEFDVSAVRTSKREKGDPGIEVSCPLCHTNEFQGKGAGSAPCCLPYSDEQSAPPGVTYVSGPECGTVRPVPLCGRDRTLQSRPRKYLGSNQDCGAGQPRCSTVHPHLATTRPRGMSPERIQKETISLLINLKHGSE